MRRAAILLALLPLLACGGEPPIPEVDQRIEIRTEVTEVESGRAFPLAVVRSWRRDLVPAPWNDDLLAPLSVRRRDHRRREEGLYVEETLTFAAYAFTPGDVELTLVDPPLRLAVRPVLDPEDPGAPELPGGLLTRPPSWPRWSAGGAGVLLLLTLVVAVRARRRSPGRPVAPTPVREEPALPPPGLLERTLSRLARLRTTEPAGRAELTAYHGEAAGALREMVGELRGLSVAERTTEELIAIEPGAGFREVLALCDLVKFAGREPNAPERSGMLDTAEAFAREAAG